MSLILHSTRRCPFCIRVRILLHLKGISFETVEEPLRKWTPWMREWGQSSGERLRVPVLRLSENGKEEMYTESNLINQMLDEKFGEKIFTPPINSAEYNEMNAWFSWCDEELKPQIDLFKYGKNLQFDKIAHIEHTKKLRELLSLLELALFNKKYLLNNTITLADIAIIPFIRQIMRTREEEFDFGDFPNIERWALSVIKTEWFSEVVMKK